MGKSTDPQYAPLFNEDSSSSSLPPNYRSLTPTPAADNDSVLLQSRGGTGAESGWKVNDILSLPLLLIFKYYSFFRTSGLRLCLSLILCLLFGWQSLVLATLTSSSRQLRPPLLLAMPLLSKTFKFLLISTICYSRHLAPLLH